MTKIFKFCITIAVTIQMVYAQVELNASADFELSYGGKNSSFETNEIVQQYRRAHLKINQLNLFVFSDLGNDFFFNSRIQWDTWGTGRLNPARITLASLSWEPVDLPVLFTMGRFTNPFGLYPRRQLASENLFVNAPLLYGYFLNISATRGFYTALGNTTGAAYGQYDAGLTTLYYGGYTTGGMVNWIIFPEAMDISLAVTNAAPALADNFTNLQNAAVITRIGFQPLIYWQQGISASFGSFMNSDPANEPNDKLERFRQTIVGTDFIFAYSYFEMSGEFAYAMWNVPGSDDTGIQLFRFRPVEYKLTNYSGYVDLKYEPPFLPGSYIAVRGEKMIFEKYDAPRVGQPSGFWDDDLLRYSAAFGYKLSHNILFKFAFSEQIYDDSTIKLEDYTFRSMITVSM